MTSKKPMAALCKLTAAYSFCHFVADFACIAITLGKIVPAFAGKTSSATFLIILAYDAFTFLLQLPFGMFMDGAKKPNQLGSLSFMCIAGGVLLATSSRLPLVLASLVLLVLGNALFHAAAAVSILDVSGADFTHTAIFLSTGGLGVFFASRTEINSALPLLLVVLGLVLIAALLCFYVSPCDSKRLEGESLLPVSLWAVAGIVFTVALRSYVGFCFAFPWKVDFARALLVALAIFAGKITGGFLGDRVGEQRAALISFAGAALLFLLSWTNVLAGLGAVFLFNISMSLTLVSLVRMMLPRRGLAFGIRSAALIVGAFPALLGVRLCSPAALAIFSVVALVLFESAFVPTRKPR